MGQDEGMGERERVREKKVKISKYRKMIWEKWEEKEEGKKISTEEEKGRYNSRKKKQEKKDSKEGRRKCKQNKEEVYRE